MVLLQDYREKKGHHKEIERYCKQHGIEIKRCQLDVGDYMFEGGTVSIDTKQSYEELAKDLHTDSKQFFKKYKRGFYNGIQLIILVSEPEPDFKKWRSRYSKITGGYLKSLIARVSRSYNVEFMSCPRRMVGKRIIEILKEKEIR